MGKNVDLTGQRFGRLVVEERAGKNKFGKTLWHCRCDCGNSTNVMVSNLTGGITMSCGCLHRETFNRITHHESQTKLYNTWRAMKERCHRPGAINYKYYGGKGVRVCDEWQNYEPFRDWALSHGYADGLTIDRINTSNDYSPDNCRFITRAENSSISAKAMQARRKVGKKVV